MEGIAVFLFVGGMFLRGRVTVLMIEYFMVGVVLGEVYGIFLGEDKGGKGRVV